MNGDHVVVADGGRGLGLADEPLPGGGAVRAVAFTPDGRYLATANANGTVYLLRVGPPSP